MSDDLQAKVNAASPAGLIVILFEELSRRARTIIDLQSGPDKQDPQIQGHVERCLQILRLLNSSLRPEHDPEFTTRVSALYEFFGKQFSAALEMGDPKKLETILPLIADLHSAWQAIDQKK